MDIENKLVAFVDILGFSKAIADFDSGKNPKIFTLLRDTVHPAAKLLKESLTMAEGSPFFNWKDCMDVRLFSDCLCVAAPLNYKTYGFIDQMSFLYKYLMGYQGVLLANGFLTRGAITIGSHYADEHMIFSGGLVEAYGLESKKAVFPRIIISDRLIDEIHQYRGTALRHLDYMISVDRDGIAFLNHFNYNLMDSEGADEDSKAFLDKLGLGTISETFLEIDIRRKKDELLETHKRCHDLLLKTQNERAQEKYLWLIEFIENELGNNTSFKSYSQFFNLS